MTRSRPRIRLRDGQAVRLRAVRRSDEAALRTFMEGLSLESRRLRFFTSACNLDEAARWAASADGDEQIGVLAVAPSGEILGHAMACRIYGARAEVAVEIDEQHRHLGLATLLITELARQADEAGIRVLIAEVLPENRDMLAVFHDGFEAIAHAKQGDVHVEFPSASWRDVVDRLEATSVDAIRETRTRDHPVLEPVTPVG